MPGGRARAHKRQERGSHRAQVRSKRECSGRHTGRRGEAGTIKEAPQEPRASDGVTPVGVRGVAEGCDDAVLGSGDGENL